MSSFATEIANASEVSCDYDPLDHGVGLLRIESDLRGMRESHLFLVTGAAPALRPVQRLGHADNPGVGHHHEDITIVRTGTHETTHGSFLTIEVVRSIHDDDPGVLSGMQLEVRSIVACSLEGEPACAGPIPLEVERKNTWVLEEDEDVAVVTAQPGVVSQPNGWFIRHSGLVNRFQVQQTEHARATAVLRRDGSMRVRLNTGSWALLVDAPLNEFILQEGAQSAQDGFVVPRPSTQGRSGRP